MDEVVCDDVTASLVQITLQVSTTTHLKSKEDTVIRYICECTITRKIRAGCELGRANISC